MWYKCYWDATGLHFSFPYHSQYSSGNKTPHASWCCKLNNWSAFGVITTILEPKHSGKYPTTCGKITSETFTGVTNTGRGLTLWMIIQVRGQNEVVKVFIYLFVGFVLYFLKQEENHWMWSILRKMDVEGWKLLYILKIIIICMKYTGPDLVISSEKLSVHFIYTYSIHILLEIFKITS